MFVATSSCLCFLGGLGVFGVWRVRVTLCWAFSFWFVCCLNFACHVFRLTYCVLVFGGPVHLASRLGVGVYLQSLFDWIWFFSSVPGARGALLIWYYGMVGRSLLIREWESVLWLKLVFGLLVALFWWFGGREVCDSYMILRLGALRNVAQLGCWGLGVYFQGVLCGWVVTVGGGGYRVYYAFFFWSLF